MLTEWKKATEFKKILASHILDQAWYLEYIKNSQNSTVRN